MRGGWSARLARRASKVIGKTAVDFALPKIGERASRQRDVYCNAVYSP